MRLVLIGLGTFSAVLMLLAGGVVLSLLGGRTGPAGYLHLMLAAVTISAVTHLLATLRTWAGR
jgi:hypothetical protein